MCKKNRLFAKYALAAILLFVGAKSEAQSTLQLLNGKQMTIGKVIDADKDYITYQSLRNANVKRISRKRVFSEINEKGTERVFYRIDSLEEMLFTEPQMRSFMKGRQEAKLNYFSITAIPLGLIFGAAGAYSATVIPVAGLLPPGLGLFCASFAAPRINKSKLSDQGLLNDAAFVQGYIEKARSKRFSYMLIGTGIGLGATIAALLNNQPHK